jgi:hypothetical protein
MQQNGRLRGKSEHGPTGDDRVRLIQLKSVSGSGDQTEQLAIDFKLTRLSRAEVAERMLALLASAANLGLE